MMGIPPEGLNEDTIMTRRELAKHLGRPVETVDHWVRHMGLPRMKMGDKKGSAVMFRWGDVKEWLTRFRDN